MNNNGSETAQSAQKDEEFEAWWDNGGTSSLRTASRYHEDAHFHAKRGWDAHAERVKDVIEAAKDFVAFLARHDDQMTYEANIKGMVDPLMSAVGRLTEQDKT